MFRDVREANGFRGTRAKPAQRSADVYERSDALSLSECLRNTRHPAALRSKLHALCPSCLCLPRAKRPQRLTQHNDTSDVQRSDDDKLV